MIKTRKLQIWKNMPVKIGFSKKHQIPTSYFISKKVINDLGQPPVTLLPLLLPV